MILINRTLQLISSLIIIVIVTTSGQHWSTNDVEHTYEKSTINITWCTISRQEQDKCINFGRAIERDKLRIGFDYFLLHCKQAFNRDECMILLDEEKVTLTSLDAGEVFVGGRYHSLIPIAQEVSQTGLTSHYAVAVVKKNTLADVTSLRDLRGKKACFANVGTLAGWIIPVYTLMKEGGMEIIDCNNHVKSTTKFFGPSCAVNALTDKYNPIGDNSDKLCQLCIGKVGDKCTDADPYSGYEGSFRCLLEAGDIAFLRHNTIEELTSGPEFEAVPKDTFELLCKDGSRKPITDYQACNWGIVPSSAIVTSSAKAYEDRRKYQKFLEKVAEIYAFNNTPPVYDDYDRSRGEYDQYGNRNRYKRQNFGDYRNTNNKSEPLHKDNYNGDDEYRRNPYDRPDSNDPYNNNRNPYANDPFRNDPYNINREEYGINIDPYQRGNNNYDRNSDTTRFDVEYDPRQRNYTYYETFYLFESSPRYGIHGNLMFQDSTRRFALLSENQQTYTGYLGKSLDIIMGVRECPVNRMSLCVTSDAEMEKCVKMRTALKAQLLKPELICYKGHSQIHCMQAIKSGNADVTVLDASDVYTAGLNFELVPFISEVYNLDGPEYYVVAVAKEIDPSTELTYLRGKNTCHGGINTAAGWVYPLAYLISNGWIRPYGCNSIRAAAEYFTKSCIPGALSSEYNTGVPYDNMCDLCHGASFRYCRRDASEDYYGHTGAFRCLVEGGGHVAFVKHTTVIENTGGKREEWWARDALADDFELLCPDGTRAEVHEYDRCNLGKVKSNAVVTRGGYAYNETQINAYINLFMYAQTYYGKKIPDEFSFSMFFSTPPYTDLIFQDATTQLQMIEPDRRYYSQYLGTEYMRARRVVDCHAGTNSLTSSILTIILVFILKHSI